MVKGIFLLATEVYKSKGGISVFNQNLIKALGEVYSGPLTVLSINDTKWEECPQFRFKGYAKNKAKFVLSALYSAAIGRPELIVCGHINISPLCLFLGKLFRIPYITFVYGVDVRNIADWKKKKGLLGSSVIVSISNFTKERIKEQFHLADDRFFILPCTVDGERFKPSDKPGYLLDRYGLHGYKVLFTICRLESSEGYKGYDKVIEALKDVVEQCGKVKYLLGGKGDDIPRIERLIRDMGLEDLVQLIGFVPEEELVDHYNLCDVFIMPSKGEGFGIVFLEALACGKTVIAGNKDGSVDAVLGGELGVLVDPDDKERIARAIVDVLQGNVTTRLLDPDYLRQTVLEHYGFDRFEARVKELIGRMSRGL